VEHETKLSAMINGNQDAGMLALMAAVETATAKCKEHGFGLAGTRNTPSSTGALGYYAQKVAEQGLIAVVLAQSPEFVAPHGAKQVCVSCNTPPPPPRPTTTCPPSSVQPVHTSITCGTLSHSLGSERGPGQQRSASQAEH